MYRGILSRLNPKLALFAIVFVIAAVFVGVILYFSRDRHSAVELEVFTHSIEFRLRDRVSIVLNKGTVSTAPKFQKNGEIEHSPNSPHCKYVGRSFFGLDPNERQKLFLGTETDAFVVEYIELIFPEGMILNVTSTQNRFVKIDIVEEAELDPATAHFYGAGADETEDVCLPANSNLVTEFVTAASDGLIVFDAENVRFGTSDHSSNRLPGVLRSGGYRILEELEFVPGLTEVRTGKLALGEQLELISSENGEDAITLQLMLDFKDFGNGEAGIHALARSSLNDIQIEIQRGRNFGTTFVRSRWYDRVLNNPAVLGITAVLVLFLTLLEIWLALWAFRKN